jgi:hypothetical protein
MVTAAVLLVGCTFTVKSFLFSFPAEGAIPELPGVLNDQTGLVVSVDEVAPAEALVMDDFMSRDATMPKEVRIQWLGGACDARVEITVSGTEHQTILVAPKRREGVCDASGIPRAVRIEFTRPLDPSQTTFDIER